MSSRFRAWARVNRLGHSQGYITQGVLSVANGYPSLTCKAYNGRLMLIFLDRCCHTCLEDHPRDVELVNACVGIRALCGWFDMLERAGRYLDLNQRAGLYMVGRKFVATVERLALIALLQGHQRWKLQPKLHCFVHVNEEHAWWGFNQRFNHCYVDEDHIGLTKKLAQCVHRGPLMEFRILCRWLLRLGSWSPSDEG
ncbi:Uncharacterized protein SCF082_LOCUS43581 [Durusdinium trenchii]|uniref:Uncharacterized protein n=1 Tax=Durusdinium trenchii TaxID=1381693 RepID=A0ABP0QW69_9DINO